MSRSLAHYFQIGEMCSSICVCMLSVTCSGGYRHFESVRVGGRQRSSPVVIYRKCSQWTILILYRKRRFTGGKNSEAIGGGQCPHRPLWIIDW